MCIADALPLLPSAGDLNNQIHESASSPRPSSRLFETPYRIVRATALQSAHLPYQPVPTPGTTRPHLLLDFAHAFDIRFGGLLSPPPVSAPVYSPGAERVCLATPSSRLFRRFAGLLFVL